MNSTRSGKATCVAAFLLGALIALLFVAPARSAEPAALDRLGVVRFTAEPGHQLRRQNGVLHDDGRFSARGAHVIARPANTPEWVLGRNLIAVEAWQAYHALGYDALSRFELHDGGARVQVGDAAFLLVGPNFETPLADGQLVNVSATTRIAPEIGSHYGVVGFVIADRPRTVLVRAVGPTLQRLGLGGWIADPFLSIRRNGQTLYFNDHWTSAAEAAAIREVTPRVGAFALHEEAADAARLVELPPGAYTVVVEPAAGPANGQVLIEVYSVPARVVESLPANAVAQPATAS